MTMRLFSSTNCFILLLNIFGLLLVLRQKLIRFGSREMAKNFYKTFVLSHSRQAAVKCLNATTNAHPRTRDRPPKIKGGKKYKGKQKIKVPLGWIFHAYNVDF